MEVWQIIIIVIGLPALFIILRRIASGQDRGKAVPPSSIGQKISIKDLQKNADSYNIYYSGQNATPAAIVFIPKDSRIIWDLKQGMNWWKPLQDKSKLNDLINAMDRELQASTVKAALRILVLPPSLEPYSSTSAYLYSDQVTTPKKIDGSLPRVSLRAIKEIRHSGGTRR
ncbi:MAG: hypothetical protein R6V39_08225 [Desulfovibrionales bacterium]